MAKIEKSGKVHIPSQRIFVGEQVLTSGWEDTVVDNAERLRARALNTSPLPAQVNTAINEVMTTVNTITGENHLNAEELVLAVEGDPVNPDLVRGQRMLAQSVFLAMRDGGNSVMSSALVTQSVSGIEAVLPDRLKPIAREVRNLTITNLDLRAVLDQMDAVAAGDMWEQIPPDNNDQLTMLKESLKIARAVTVDVKNPDEVVQRQTVIGSLRARIREIEEKQTSILQVGAVGSGVVGELPTADHERVVVMIPEEEPRVDVDHRGRIIGHW